MLQRYLQTTLHPERYHGSGKRGPFFEGWYYKLVDLEGRQRYAIIPGIFLGIDGDNDEAFVQVLNGMTGEATYHVFPSSAFSAAADALDVRVGPNRFCEDSLSLDIQDEQLQMRGELRFEGTTPWPVTLTSPGIMGWYGWLPFMECYHGVVSLDHLIRGTLHVNGEALDFTGGRGYIEKDWGQAFPSAYIWMQTNHFDAPGVSLTASIARIPWQGRAFPGFIVGFWHQRQLYRFATYTGATAARLDVTDEHVNWVLRDRRYTLEIEAVRRSGGLLKAPIRTEMHRRVDETMQSEIHVRLLDGSTPLFEGHGSCAALEVHGEIETLRS